MTFVEALRGARVLIANGTQDYICNAIEFQEGIHWSEAKRYKNRIQAILDIGIAPYDMGCSYYQWLKRNHPRICRKMTPDNFRQGRLQWIDYLIAEELRLGC